VAVRSNGVQPGTAGSIEMGYDAAHGRIAA
jgi:hypothetical protein